MRSMVCSANVSTESKLMKFENIYLTTCRVHHSIAALLVEFCKNELILQHLSKQFIAESC